MFAVSKYAPQAVGQPRMKEPWGRAEPLAETSNGKEPSTPLPISTGRGSTSNNPKPPATEVLPFLNGSQAKPTRGSKFLFVGFIIYGLPKKGFGMALFNTRRFESLPLCSVMMLAISYRTPQLRLRFGRRCVSSWK